MPRQEAEGPKKFDVVFRGYARGPVDEYVARLHEWLLDSEARADNAVQAAAAAVGERVNDILRAALEAGEQARQSAEKEAAKLVAQAEERANEALRFAERRSEQLRERADAALREAEKANAAAQARAEAQAKRKMDEARGEIEALEATISELDARKERILADLARLQAFLAGAPEAAGAAEGGEKSAKNAGSRSTSGTAKPDKSGPSAENGDRPVTQPSSAAG